MRCALAGFLALALAGSAGCDRPSEPSASSAARDPSRERIRSFWQVYNSATALRVAGDCAAAAERYRRALGLDPAHEDALYYLGSCLSELGEYREAARVYERLVAANPQSARGHFQLGTVLGTPLPGAPLDLAAARRALERNVALNREESGPFLRLGELALYRDDTAEALRFFDTAAGFQSPEGIFRSGLVRALRGDARGAAERFRAVIDLNARERAISGRGVRSEGDVVASEGRLTPLEQAGIAALVHLSWLPGASDAAARPEPANTRSRVAGPAGGSGSLRFEPDGAARANVESVRDLWTAEWREGAARCYARSATADLDGDGAAERIEAGNPPAALRVVTPRRAKPLDDFSRPVVDVAAADFDGDGRADLAALAWKGGLRLLRNRGGLRFDEVTGLAQDRGDAFAFAAIDYDRDGRRDLIQFPYAPRIDALRSLAGRAPAQRARVLRNRGGVFEEIGDLPGLDQPRGVVRAIAADFDGDGFEDLLLACGGLDPLRLEPSVVLRNCGGHGFELAALLGGSARPFRALGAEVRDYDADGRPDVLLRTPAATLRFRNLSRPGTRP